MPEKTINYRFPNPVWFVIRLILLAFLVFLFFSLLTDYISERGMVRKARDLSGDTTFYDDYYYDRQYGALRDLLYLDDVPDDGSAVYGKFWEIVHAYEHRVAAMDYAAGAEAGLDYAAAYAEEERAALESIAADPAFPENEPKLQELLE